MKPFPLGAIVFFLLILSGCDTPYDAYAELRDWEASKSAIASSTGALSVSGSYRIWMAPEDRPGNRLRELLDTARTRIDLNVYLLSDVWVINSLILAHRRNIPVRVILERSVYDSPGGNNRVFGTLRDEGIPTVWADEVRQNFNHAKYVLADGILFVGTGNFTTTSFEKNREFFIETKDRETVDFMERLFRSDFYRFPFGGSLPNAYLSPTDSRTKIEYALLNARRSIQVFAASLSDERLLGMLEQRRAAGLEVKVCLAYEKNSERSALVRRMESHRIVFEQAKNPYVHAKTILIDGRTLMIGSENFTKNSLDQNREVGLILQDSYFVKKYRETILGDCRDG